MISLAEHYKQTCRSPTYFAYPVRKECQERNEISSPENLEKYSGKDFLTNGFIKKALEIDNVYNQIRMPCTYTYPQNFQPKNEHRRKVRSSKNGKQCTTPIILGEAKYKTREPYIPILKCKPDNFSDVQVYATYAEWLIVKKLQISGQPLELNLNQLLAIINLKSRYPKMNNENVLWKFYNIMKADQYPRHKFFKYSPCKLKCLLMNAFNTSRSKSLRFMLGPNTKSWVHALDDQMDQKQKKGQTSFQTSNKEDSVLSFHNFHIGMYKNMNSKSKNNKNSEDNDGNIENNEDGNDNLSNSEDDEEQKQNILHMHDNGHLLNDYALKEIPVLGRGLKVGLKSSKKKKENSRKKIKKGVKLKAEETKTTKKVKTFEKPIISRAYDSIGDIARAYSMKEMSKKYAKIPMKRLLVLYNIAKTHRTAVNQQEFELMRAYVEQVLPQIEEQKKEMLREARTRYDKELKNELPPVTRISLIVEPKRKIHRTAKPIATQRRASDLSYHSRASKSLTNDRKKRKHSKKKK